MVDDYTIKIKFKDLHQYPALGSVSTYVVSKAAYDAHGGGKDAENWMRIMPSGPGPFKFVSLPAKRRH